MPAIVLQTADCELLGLLMLAGQKPLNADDTPRDCVLSGFPRDPLLQEDPRNEIIQRYKHHEFKLTITATTDGHEVTGQIDEGLSINLNLRPDHIGGWQFVLNNSTLETGVCQQADATK